MLNNRLANNINQSLAVIKLLTYSIIAGIGIYRLIVNWPISRINWQQQLSGNTDITAYSTSILLVNKTVQFFWKNLLEVNIYCTYRYYINYL